MTGFNRSENYVLLGFLLVMPSQSLLLWSDSQLLKIIVLYQFPTPVPGEWAGCLHWKNLDKQYQPTSTEVNLDSPVGKRSTLPKLALTPSKIY